MKKDNLNKDNEDLEIKLLANIPIKVEGLGEIKPLKLKEIIKLGLSKYYQYLNNLCFDIDDLDINEETKIKLNEGNVGTFFVLIAQCTQGKDDKNNNSRDFILDSLKFFLKDDVVFVEELSEFYIGDIENAKDMSDLKVLNIDNYEDFKKALIKQNCIKKEKDDYKPANERAKKFIEKLKKNKKEAPKPKSNINLHSIISSVAWKSGKGTNSILNLSIYQLYDAFYRLEVVDNFDRTMQGIMAGNVDAKKIDLKKINWSKIIKLND